MGAENRYDIFSCAVGWKILPLAVCGLKMWFEVRELESNSEVLGALEESK